MNENKEILRAMCRMAREAWRDWREAEKAGLVAVAEIHRGRWDTVADACYGFATREGLRIRTGQTTGKSAAGFR